MRYYDSRGKFTAAKLSQGSNVCVSARVRVNGSKVRWPTGIKSPVSTVSPVIDQTRLLLDKWSCSGVTSCFVASVYVTQEQCCSINKNPHKLFDLEEKDVRDLQQNQEIDISQRRHKLTGSQSLLSWLNSFVDLCSSLEEELRLCYTSVVESDFRAA